jgi:hypothetical protein
VSLRHLTVACHVLLIITLAASVLTAATLLRAGIAILLVLPLLLTLRGLAAGRRPVEQRLAVLLVVYAGGASVEVVAQSGAVPLLSVALLAAVLELGLLLALIRRPAARG